MMIARKLLLGLLALSGAITASVVPASAQSMRGQVLGAGAPIAGATVTLWAASTGAPAELAQTRTGADGRFALDAPGERGKGATLYLVAKGGTPKAAANKGADDAVALLALLGASLPETVTVNELTTVASAFTAAQFINGESISGNPLGLQIAAGNVPNLVDPRDRRVGQGAAGPAQQHPDHDAREPGYARLAHQCLRHRGQ